MNIEDIKHLTSLFQDRCDNVERLASFRLCKAAVNLIYQRIDGIRYADAYELVSAIDISYSSSEEDFTADYISAGAELLAMTIQTFWNFGLQMFSGEDGPKKLDTAKHFRATMNKLRTCKIEF